MARVVGGWIVKEEIKLKTPKGRELFVRKIEKDGMVLLAINKDFRGVAWEPEMTKEIIKSLKKILKN